MRKLGLATLLTFAFTSSGCFLFNTSPTPEELEQQFDNAPPKRLIANYDPLNAVLPYPSNLVFSGTEDGTINIPVGAPDDYADPQVVLNSLDGFSTMQPMTLTFNGVVDESTIRAGDTIRVFEVELFSFFLYATDVIRELDAPDPLLGKVGEYTTSVFSSVNVGPDGEAGTVDDFVYDGVMINPTQPLKPETAYVAIVTNDVRAPDGTRAKYDLIYGVSKGLEPLIDENGHTVVQYVEGAVGALGDDDAAALEPLRQINSSFETAIGLATGLSTDKIILSFGFTTQSVETMLKVIAENLEPGDINVGPTIDLTGTRVTSSQTLGSGTADVYLGTLDVPYYLSPNTSACHYSVDGKDGTEDCPAITDRWTGYQGNFPTKFYYIGGGYGPEQKGTETIPFFLTVPNANSGCVKPAEGWPVTMFVHTMTQARWNMFAVTDILDRHCVAGFAMDLPLHGINKHTGSAGQPGCEGATDVLYAFSADAPASYTTTTCTCEDVDGEAVYSSVQADDGLGLYQLMPWFNDVRGTVRERTLGVDRSANYPVEGGDNGPDGITDSSGTHFFNPAAMLTIRDSMRQGVVDLMVAAKSIPTITDTWTGTELGLQVQLSTLPLIPDGCLPAGSSIPACGPLVSTGLPALQISDAGSFIFPNGSVVESIVADLTAAGASASAVVASTELAGVDEIPTSGTLYDLSMALQVSAYVGDAYLTSLPGCGTADVVNLTADATLLANTDALVGTSASGAWLADFSKVFVTSGDISAVIGSATTAAEALEAATQNVETKLAAATASIVDGSWTDYAASIATKSASITPLLSTYVDTFVNDATEEPDFREGVGALGAGVDALASLGGITTVGCAAGEVACLGENTGNISAGTRGALLNTYRVAAPAYTTAQGVMDLGEAGWESLETAFAVELLDVEAGSVTVSGASDAVVAALDAYNTAAADAEAGIAAFQASSCLDPAALAPLAAAEIAAIDLVTAIGNAAGSVSLLAADVVNAEDLVDSTTVIGPAYTLLAAAQGALDSLTALSGATADITTALTAWDSGEPIFDAANVSATGHGVGASLAFVAATMEPSISSVAMAAPSGSLAYAFEVSETVGPLLVDGLKDAAGIAPGEPLWESFFAVLQASLDQADPTNFIDYLDDHQAILMIELEDDEFFPAEDANRPLAGSSVLASQMGLKRIANSYSADGDSPVRAVTRLNTDDSWGVHATFLAPYFGCVENACGVAELDLACNAANEELRQEAWSQIGTFLSSSGKSVTVNTVGAGTGNSLIDVVP